MKSIRFETKTLSDSTIRYAANELQVNKDYIDLQVIEEKRSILGLNKTYIVEASIKFDIFKDGIQYLQTILTAMEIDAIVEAKLGEDRQIIFSINAAENPVLIGKNGKTLEAIQTMIKNYIGLYTEEPYVVLVDIGGYKSQRKKQLEILATKTAKEVAKSKVSARLGKMNAYERRVIHTKLSDWRDVTTESEGEEPNRYVVIKPKQK
ncbi:MAG: KH domain-containing protein [Candidatus Izemoplasmatales bacterium]|jgi:spoIIIJ-associated protein|nr:KH domain-containing protein [Candidatus Izemoplasmatales bacterium]MDD4354397.1 KH domain-containing protein [Candidatus Izemoplasmatales bacterium]MDD4987486.1 KH domain-containing protein [Candidatus Izemoplasmatales bacterium]MDD5601809.1 KH domain-containing protein [Candidatus Izemoplasmatales bacterium]MDY0372975.1 RNA-binding cell elongation regulator Jag/EloR [Candidatus Izemoplasmatales bacterium]